MKLKQKLALMGKIVTVDRTLTRAMLGDSFDRVEWRTRPMSPPRAGWVVGFSFVQNGTIKPPEWKSWEDPHPDGARYLKVSCTVPCAWVVFWPTHKPVRVPIDALVEGGTPENRTAFWTAAQREFARKESKTYPRRNGKFCKQNIP